MHPFPEGEIYNSTNLKYIEESFYTIQIVLFKYKHYYQKIYFDLQSQPII